MATTRMLVVGVAALVMAATLGSCSLVDSKDPIVEGTSDPSPSPSPTGPPPPPPDLPDTATQKTVDGGVEFVEYYYNLVEYGHETGKWKPLRNLTDHSCKECQNFWNGRNAFEADEDVLAEIGTPNPRGIEGMELEVVVNLRVGPGLYRAGSDMEVRDNTKKFWQDDVTVSYREGWSVVQIEPTQLIPSEGCLAGRCEDFQKRDAKKAEE